MSQFIPLVMTTKPLKILISRTDALGDVITCFPMVAEIKRLVPGAEITFFVKKIYCGLVADLQYVDAVIEYMPMGKELINSKIKRANFKLNYYKINQAKFDIVFCVYPRPMLAWLFYRTRIPVRIGSFYRWYSFLFNYRFKDHRKYSIKHESQYNSDMVELLKHPKIKLEIYSSVRKSTAKFTLNHIRVKNPILNIHNYAFNLPESFIIIHPMKSDSSLVWSLNNFDLLIKKMHSFLLKNRWQIILTGLPDENNQLVDLANKNSELNIKILTNLTLQQLCYIISKAIFWVGNSTGPMHIASYINIPVLALFGKAPAFKAIRWGPVYNSNSFSYEADVKQCKKCIYEKCKDFNCIDKIRPQTVFEDIKNFIIK